MESKFFLTKIQKKIKYSFPLVKYMYFLYLLFLKKQIESYV